MMRFLNFKINKKPTAELKQIFHLKNTMLYVRPYYPTENKVTMKWTAASRFSSYVSKEKKKNLLQETYTSQNILSILIKNCFKIVS